MPDRFLRCVCRFPTIGIYPAWAVGWPSRDIFRTDGSLTAISRRIGPGTRCIMPRMFAITASRAICALVLPMMSIRSVWNWDLRWPANLVVHYICLHRIPWRSVRASRITWMPSLPRAMTRWMRSIPTWVVIIWAVGSLGLIIWMTK